MDMSGHGGSPGAGRPLLDALERELAVYRRRRTFGRAIWETCGVLVVVAAVAVLLSTLWIPVLQISGNSMEPTLGDGELIVVAKTSRLEDGQLVAFYYNNKVLVKRVIAQGGDEVNITDDGTVFVNGIALEEPYLPYRSLGECDLTLPFTVPDGRLFVMGDSRATSVDSRSTALGTVSADQIIGRAAFRVWPLGRFGPLTR